MLGFSARAYVRNRAFPLLSGPVKARFMINLYWFRNIAATIPLNKIWTNESARLRVTDRRSDDSTRLVLRKSVYGSRMMNKHRTFRIEKLENKTLMAGDVGIAVSAGDLNVTGDASDNEVVIRATEDAGMFAVEGLNGTTINGRQSVTVKGVNDDMFVNLGNGDNPAVCHDILHFYARVLAFLY